MRTFPQGTHRVDGEDRGDPRLESFARWLRAVDGLDIIGMRQATRHLRAAGISVCVTIGSPAGRGERR
jgi:hypothetical protein